MKRRRTRYKFVVESARKPDAHRIDVMHYSADDAFAYLERAGYYNIERVTAQPRPQGGGWTVDTKALREAIDFLGIKLPVRVKQTGRVGPQSGAHYFRQRAGKFMKNPSLDTASGGFYHHITVKNYLSPDEAGRTLWHELAHAMQAERETANAATMREAFDAWRFCSARGRGITYRQKPIEVEAREHECLNDDNPLAR